MEFILWSSVFIISLMALVKCADYFTDYAEKLGLLFKISPFIVGVTIVTLGTTLPELSTSITAVLKGHSEIVIGNVIGSSIANILLVVGIIAIIAKKISINRDMLHVDLPIILGSVIILFLTTLDGKFTFMGGLLTLAMLTAYITYNVQSGRKVPQEGKRELKNLKEETIEEKEDEHLKTSQLKIKYISYLILLAAFIALAANFTILAVENLSRIFNIGKEIIAISAIAIGTSLPELAVGIMAAKKGKTEIVIGNILGANIFNTLGVMGVASIFGTLHVPDNILTMAIPTLLIVTVLYVFTIMDRQITKWEGITFLLIYIAFIGKTFGLV